MIDYSKISWFFIWKYSHINHIKDENWIKSFKQYHVCYNNFRETEFIPFGQLFLENVFFSNFCAMPYIFLNDGTFWHFTAPWKRARIFEQFFYPKNLMFGGSDHFDTFSSKLEYWSFVLRSRSTEKTPVSNISFWV